MMKNVLTVMALIFTAFLITGCSPEVGSEEWCADIKEKGAANVTANEAADFAKHCVL